MKKPDPDILDIDKLALDEEWCGFAKVYEYWLEVLANLKRELREKENELEFTEAQLKMRIRRRPKHFGMSKTTEPAIKETMIVQPEYQTLKKEINRTKHKVEVVDGFCKALDAKKKGLEKVVDLHGQQYFAMPRAPKMGRDEARDMKQKVARRKFKV